MIVLLLNYSNQCQAQTNDSLPSTGDLQLSDTAVTIDIKYIRLANAKLIERKYLLDIVNEQDSIISFKDNYITEQKKIITDFQNRVDNAIKINEVIKQDIEKQKKRTKIVGGIAGSAIAILVISLICK